MIHPDEELGPRRIGALAAVLALALALTALAAWLAPARGGAATPATLPTRSTTLQPNPGYLIMPMGDSITVGAGSSSGTGYRGTLAALVPGATWAGTQGTAPLWHEGHGSWTLDQLAAQARNVVSVPRPRYVLLLAGTMDVAAGRTAAQLLASTASVIAEIKAGSPKTVILVMSIPVTTNGNAAQQQVERDYNAALPALVTAFLPRVRYLDVSDVGVGFDTTHPSDSGYAVMAQRLAAALPQVIAD